MRGDVAGIEEAEGGVADAFLSAYERQHLGGGVEVVDAEPGLVPDGDGFPYFGEAVGFGVAMVGGSAGGGYEPVDDGVGGRDVRVADAEGDDFDALRALFCDDAGDFDEGVGGEFIQAAGKFHVFNTSLFCSLGLDGGFNSKELPK